ncbi:hypothetical protein B7P43_G13031 [Cryptotermes secundus]|uniref:Uncharacterized protein n=1 Tax=Cryptotermes secundus TaxID=105785 RepID=A0A2J7PFX5_9NEOP|nr:hypothetical protein B7P43_G13031 [Cryptotermes secundus]
MPPFYLSLLFLVVLIFFFRGFYLVKPVVLHTSCIVTLNINNISLIINLASRHEDVWEARGMAPPDGAEGTASSPFRFSPRERTPCTHCIGWVKQKSIWTL